MKFLTYLRVSFVLPILEFLFFFDATDVFRARRHTADTQDALTRSAHCALVPPALKNAKPFAHLLSMVIVVAEFAQHPFHRHHHLLAMTERDEKWNMKREKLVEFERMNGHCRVPRIKCEQDASPKHWVDNQRTGHGNDKNRLDRKRILDKIGFVWKHDGAHNGEIWHEEHEKLDEFEQKNGHRVASLSRSHEQDKSPQRWIKNQRARRSQNKMPPDQKKLLGELEFEFIWACSLLLCSGRRLLTTQRGSPKRDL
jgi:hypothetical protein